MVKHPAPKPRNPIARELSKPLYRQRTVESDKVYRRLDNKTDKRIIEEEDFLCDDEE